MRRGIEALLLYLALFVAIAYPAQAQEALRFGAPVTGVIAGGESHSYTFAANAGDEVSGQAELLGPEGNLQFLDASGNRVEDLKVRGWYLGGTAGRRLGFVAPSSGTFQVRITATGSQRGTYTLRLEKLAVGIRMRGVSVTPKEVSISERIRRLSQDVQQVGREAVEQFWREVADKGPLIESIPGNDRDLLVTFLWRETYETHNVLAGWPMAAWREDDYYMSRLGNTNVWYKTIQIARGSRFSYWISPNLRAVADRLFNDQLDPLNPRVFPEDQNSLGNDLSSVLDTPGAPDESFALRTPVRRGTVEHKKLRLAGNESEMWVYTPPGYATTAGPYPFVLLFDGFMYTRPDFNNALVTLDNLINDGRMRPAVVCFVDSLYRGLASGNGFREELVTYEDALVRELLPQLRSAYAITTSARDTVIGGFSAGGLFASQVALRHSDVFGNVLAQSGAFRLRKPGSGEPTTVAQLYLDAPRLPVRFYLEVGLYENTPSARLPLHEMALDEGITTSNRHFRDVLIGKGYQVTYRETPGAHESVHWRATLADALMTLLHPAK